MTIKLAEKYLDRLQPEDGESAEAYAGRLDALKEEYEAETGEKLNPHALFEGQAAEDALARSRMLSEADKLRGAGRDEESSRQRAAEEARSSLPTTTNLTGAARINAQERRAKAVVESFEAEKKRLFRDGERLYSEKEHRLRLEEIRQKYSERLDGLISEVGEDVKKSQRTARGLEYADPAASLTPAERDRLAASAVLASEDVRRLSWPELSDRLEAVEAGEDRVAKIVHAQSAAARIKGEEERLNNLARNGQRNNSSDGDRQALRQARKTLTRLEESLADPQVKKRREQAREAVQRSRKLAGEMSRMRSKVDGTAERARRETAQHTHAAF